LVLLAFGVVGAVNAQAPPAATDAPSATPPSAGASPAPIVGTDAAPAAAPGVPASTPSVAPGASGAGPTPVTMAPTSALPSGVTADEEYGLKMKELEDSVSELKEQIFRSKAKLTLLTEQVQGGTGAGARIVITHKNLMGPNFLLVEVNYFLDGTPLWQEVDDEGRKLTAMKEHPLWDGNIVEGSHTLTVELRYKGNGTGVFQYLSGYTWKLKDALSFTAESGKLVEVDVVGFEGGNFTTEMSERPKLRFDKNVQSDVVKKSESTK
jgi:hypothetical protein